MNLLAQNVFLFSHFQFRAEVKKNQHSLLLRRACWHVDVGTCPHQVLIELKKNPKSKFNFVFMSSLELTHFTSADSDVKEKEYFENVENLFFLNGESFNLIIFKM